VEKTQDQRYLEATAEFGASLERLARAYEADSDQRRDLLQEIHLGLWRSFAAWDGRCSLRTWTYRVAHNIATSHAIRRRRHTYAFTGLEELDGAPAPDAAENAAGERHALDRLLALVQELKPLDRQVILCWLEGMDAASIGEITGLSPGNVATKLHRIRSILTQRFHQGGRHG
jgi:RNA polymerase sigma-70 factor (ECF subfamily)